MHFANDPLRVLISGAASGVGLACAEAFAASGAELILSDIDGSALTRVAERLGARAAFCDALSDSSVAIFAAEVKEKLVALDVLINAAAEGYVRSLAMIRMSRALLPLLRRANGRRFIVNVAPTVGFAFAEDLFPYASSRPAFERLTRALADQTKGTSVKVISVTPGMVQDGGPAAAHRLSRMNPLDAEFTAARILGLIAGERPDWGQQAPPQRSRRGA